jgi:hypothetical protein
MQVDTAADKVRQAKWEWTQEALRGDHARLDHAVTIPHKVKLAQHKKQVKARFEQEERGQHAVASYMKKYLQISSLSKAEHLLAELTKAKNAIAAWTFESYSAVNPELR